MKKLLTLGCSLAPIDSWPYTCNQAGQFDIHTNYGFGGGGNQQLLDCIDEYLYHNTTKDLTVVYQMTGMERGGGIYSSGVSKELIDHKTKLRELSNILPDQRSLLWEGYFGKQYMLWGSSLSHGMHYDEHHNHIILLTRVVSKLCLLANAGVTVYAFRGWTGIIPHAPEKTWEQITDVFDKNNVNYIDEPLVDWCIKTDQEFMPDNWHPRTSASRYYAEEFLSKQLASDT
jgi:hypothetical protein